mmetsp:Transcript_59560/g.158472  ORF Transcript_59560/g.158472 Transcript_59560/m.158472 type:complete len:179 (+) Transcript_59560:214-750(+)
MAMYFRQDRRTVQQIDCISNKEKTLTAMEIGLPVLFGSDSPVSSQVRPSGIFNARRRNSVDVVDCGSNDSFLSSRINLKESASFNSKVPASFNSKRRNSVHALDCSFNCEIAASSAEIVVVDFNADHETEALFSRWAPEPLPRKLPCFPAPPPKLHYTTRWRYIVRKAYAEKVRTKPE